MSVDTITWSFVEWLLGSPERTDRVASGGMPPVTASDGDDASPRPAHDTALIAALHAGSHTAFEQLFHTYYAPLRAFAERLLGSSDDAADVVEEVFVRLWEGRASLDVRTSVAAYLYGAVRRRVAYVRRGTRTRAALRERFPSDVADRSVSAAQGSPDHDVHVAAIVQTIHAAIAALPERRRLVVTLRWEAGLDNQEIAAVLGIAPQSVANLLQRALADLRAALPRDLV